MSADVLPVDRKRAQTDLLVLSSTRLHLGTPLSLRMQRYNMPRRHTNSRVHVTAGRAQRA